MTPLSEVPYGGTVAGPSDRQRDRRAPGGLLARAWKSFERTVASILFWRSVSRTIGWLNSLDDRQLAAKGLKRSEIVAAVYRQAGAERQTREGEAASRKLA
ncbi:MAG: hypothetical protein Tsb0032_44150 [Kiloniellaceae bacterium]